MFMDQDSLETSDVARDGPVLTFEEGSYSLPELLDSHLLPVVVQYDNERKPIPFQEFNFDLTQPLLFYKKRNIQKVAARSLCIRDGKYQEVGESFLIPEDYKGLFGVLQRITGSSQADDTVPHFATIEELSNSNTDKFLIGGSKRISGIQIKDRTESYLKHEQRHVMPGDILTVETVSYGETKKRTRLFRKPKYITEKFMLCRDETGQKILLPFEQTGIFYQISHKNGKPNKNVLQMSDIVARKLMPRIIKLVFGKFPVTPCVFTGLMTAESSRIETSIIASTISNANNILLEIPVTSAMYFKVAVMTDELRKNIGHRNAMSLCVERATTYMRNIKVCYNFAADDIENDDEETLRNISDSVVLRSDSMSRSANDDLLIEDQYDDFAESDTIKHAKVKPARFHGFCRNKMRKTLEKSNSIDKPNEFAIRPSLAVSTFHVSFCLGNSYLTVPVVEHDMITKRNSGNNNTFNEAFTISSHGSPISINKNCIEEPFGEDDNNTITNEGVTDRHEIESMLACTNAGSYVNCVNPPDIRNDSEFPNYRPAAARQPSTQPPDSAPPPVPRSSSTSGVSSGSTSSASEEADSKHGSTDSFEYDVPKIEDPNTILCNISGASKEQNKGTQKENLVLRPSTCMFSEGRAIATKHHFQCQTCNTIDDTMKTSAIDRQRDSPIYENIKPLMEIVAQLELENDQNDHTSSQTETNTNSAPNETAVVGDVGSFTTAAVDSDECTVETRNMCCIDSNLIQIANKSTNVDTDKKVTVEEIHTKVSQSCCWSHNDRNGSFNCVSDTVNVDLVPNLDQNMCTCDSNQLQSDNFILLTDDSSDRILKANTIQIQELVALKSDTDQISAHNIQVFSNAPNENISERNIAGTVISSSGKSEKCTQDKLVNGRLRWKYAFNKLRTIRHKKSIRGMTPAGSCPLSPSKRIICHVKGSCEKPFIEMSVDELIKKLSLIGIKSVTVSQLKQLAVDGSKLKEVLDGIVSVKDCLIGVNLVDQQKISMFIRGWNPSID